MNPTAAKSYPLDAAGNYVEKQGDQWLKVRWDLLLAGVQVDDIEVRVRFMDPNNTPIQTWTDIIVASNALQGGLTSHKAPRPNLVAFDFSPVPAGGQVGISLSDGWYNVQVCARDLDLPGAPPGPKGRTYGWFCDIEQQSVLVDRAGPGARLIKPADGAMVSGEHYLLVGKAWDPESAENDPAMQYGAIAATRFEYCAKSNYQTENKWCGPTDQSWIKIADGAPTPGVTDQWDAKFDSTQLPDDHGAIRFCATDLVGLTNCTPQVPPNPFRPIYWLSGVYVVNRHTVNLRPGWNLVSTPLMLYNNDMDSVLFHLKDPVTNESLVKSVWTVYNKNAGEPDVYDWVKWMPGDDMKFKDGRGYWINMKSSATLTFVGSFKELGAAGAPPEYPVFEGWNLIGYTHWGQPSAHWLGDKSVLDYLGIPLGPSVEALWRYDAWSEMYIPMGFANDMVKGFGYWLGIAQGGTINP